MDHWSIFIFTIDKLWLTWWATFFNSIFVFVVFFFPLSFSFSNLTQFEWFELITIYLLRLLLFVIFFFINFTKIFKPTLFKYESKLINSFSTACFGNQFDCLTKLWSIKHKTLFEITTTKNIMGERNSDE